MTELYGSQHDVARLFCASVHTVKRYRKEMMQEGIHYVCLNKRKIIYNLELIQDLIQNASDPVAHQRAIERYFANLPSNQKQPLKNRDSKSKQKHPR